MTPGLNCSVACGIFLDQELNCVPYLGNQIRIHCVTREVLGFMHYKVFAGYFFVFHFEQAGVSFMRSICSFTSLIQSIYGIAYGNMACSQSHKTFHIIPRRVNVCVCACVCVCVCVCEETEQYNSRILFGLVQRLLILPANHNEDELSARSGVQADPTPSSCI